MIRAGASMPARRIGDVCASALRLAGWLVVSAGCVAGLWALFFAVLGSFSFAGFVFHLDNFAARYIAADGARAARFQTQFWLASGVLFTLVGLLRRAALVRALGSSKEIGHGQ
jgi:hypothetical protein